MLPDGPAGHLTVVISYAMKVIHVIFVERKSNGPQFTWCIHCIACHHCNIGSARFMVLNQPLQPTPAVSHNNMPSRFQMWAKAKVEKQTGALTTAWAWGGMMNE